MKPGYLYLHLKMKLASMLLVAFFSACLCVSIGAAAVEPTSAPRPAVAELFESLIDNRATHAMQRKKGTEDFDMSVFVKSIASLRVTYLGSTRAVEGCSGPIIGGKYILLPEECVAASNGEPVLDIPKTSTSQGIGLSAIFLPKTPNGLAVVQLKQTFGSDKKVAEISTAIISSKPVAMMAGDGSSTQYRHRTYAWCNRMRPAPGESDLFSCVTPENVAVCPANHGTIAFETSDTGAALIGFAKGGDCSTQEELGISWISLISPFAADLSTLMANGGMDAKFAKHV